MDPIGEARGDFRTSYLASIITNLAIAIHGQKGTRPKNVSDFIFDWDVTKPKEGTQQSAEDIKRIFSAIAATNSKKEEKDKKRALRNSKRIPKSLQK